MGDASSTRVRVLMAGAPGGGTLAAPAHDFIAKCLGRSWRMSFLEALTIREVIDAFRSPDFAGGIVTMPWKKSIIPYLDHVDDIVSTIGACNHVSVAENNALHGTNTDWIGIKDALMTAAPANTTVGEATGLIVGAGGASRAAVYALTTLGCRTIHVVNRDAEEVQELIEDVQKYKPEDRPNVVHVQSVQHAQSLSQPQYIVGTIPDFGPTTASEVQARDVYAELLSKQSNPGKGIMLDMCYHPLLTRNLRLAQQHGWCVVNGVEVVRHQLKEQWQPWTGQRISRKEEETAWRILQECVLSDPSVTPAEKKL